MLFRTTLKSLGATIFTAPRTSKGAESLSPPVSRLMTIHNANIWIIDQQLFFQLSQPPELRLIASDNNVYHYLDRVHVGCQVRFSVMRFDVM